MHSVKEEMDWGWRIEKMGTWGNVRRWGKGMEKHVGEMVGNIFILKIHFLFCTQLMYSDDRSIERDFRRMCQTCTHTHTLTQSYTHKFAHTTHSCIHTHDTQSDRQTMHACSHSRTHTHTHHARMLTHMHTYKCTRTRVHTYRPGLCDCAHFEASVTVPGAVE